MKRSRPLLGATTALPTIAAIAAAKAYRFSIRKSFYYTKTHAGRLSCTKVCNTFCTITGSGNLCITPETYVLYSQGGGSVLSNTFIECVYPVAYNAE